MKSKALVKVMQPSSSGMAAEMRDVLRQLGEDPAREGLVRTPERYEKAMRYLTSGRREAADMRAWVDGR